jgi:prepilin-type N-terminal cleavage/methylation domain-containing protein
MLRRGFTLVEVLVTSAVLVVLGGILLAVWLACRPIFDKTEGKLNAQHRVREPLLRVMKALRTAMGPPGESALLQPPANSSGAMLEFYSCDVLAGRDRPLDPRDPQRFVYRVLRRTHKTLWLEMWDVNRASLLEERQLGGDVEMRFSNLNSSRVRIEASASVPVRDTRGYVQAESVQMDTVVSVPFPE